MPIVINGDGTISGITTGGLPDGIVDTDMLANNAVTSAKSSGLGGLTVADQYALNSSNGGDANPVTGWYRPSNNSRASLNGNVSESSGIFTFSSTGYYRVDVIIYNVHNVDERYNQFFLEQSTDSGSNWNHCCTNSSSVGSRINSTGHLSGCMGAVILDVTDVSTFRLKLRTNSESNSTSSYLSYDADSNYTSILFMKLGDT